MIEITVITPSGRENIKTEKGRKLSEVLIEKGYEIATPCGQKGTCGKCQVKINGTKERSCRYSLSENIIVELDRDKLQKEKINTISANYDTNCKLCLDLGSTMMTMALINQNGEVVRELTRKNPQSRFGADVISRIDYATKNGTNILHECSVDEIISMAQALSSDVFEIYVSGNTVMLHILANSDYRGLGVAPYTSMFLDAQKFDIESKNQQKYSIKTVPCISAFVGGDIVSGLEYIGYPSGNKYNLLVDLGTNCEIVLFSKNKMLCTSAAAGPSFEGANISSGMSAVDGAICEYDNGEYKTIGNTQPLGICATGLIDIIVYLIKRGIVEENGYMPSGNFRITEKVGINQADIRAFQLAKSAVFSGILAMFRHSGVSFEEVENFYVAGGFAENLNLANAVSLGLLPKELIEQYKPIKNSSLKGVVKIASKRSQMIDISKASYIDLSTDVDFTEDFIENMSF
ncbi:MAG TPA: DUF4445 domain-containing protein [Clostridiales bacterium]|nr:DUF4445 domain-containing protein [Clostridiales bacterium]